MFLYLEGAVLRQGILILILFAISPAVWATDTPGELQRKIDTINQQSERLLGVSLTALLYLKDASPDEYLLLAYVKESGGWSALKELERKGYVKLVVVDQLPDGQRLGKHLRIIPTALGVHLQTCIRNITTASTRTPKSGAQ